MSSSMNVCKDEQNIKCFKYIDCEYLPCDNK